MSEFVIITGDFSPWGGMDRANYELARYVARRGDSVHLVAHGVEPELAGHRNVVVHRVARLGGSHLLGALPLDRAGRWFGRRQQRGDRYVIVNGGNCHLADVNWVHYVHSAWRSRTDNLELLRRFKTALSHRYFVAAERSIIPRARLVIANSERTREDLIRYLGIPENRIQVVYYGTDPDTLQPANSTDRATARKELGWPTDRPVVAFLGELGDERKGFDMAYAAWKTLCKARSWDADLIVIGSGRAIPLWQKQSRQDGIAARIQFLGFRRDVPRLLGACDLLISPTRYEAYGLGVHEAVCCGLPAIVSRSAGVAERYPLDLDDLLLDDPEDMDELVARLLHWRGALEDWPRRLVPLRRTLSDWSWDDMAGRISTLIHDSHSGVADASRIRAATRRHNEMMVPQTCGLPK